MRGWRVVAPGTGPVASLLALLWLGGGLIWLGWPVWDSVGTPSSDQLRAEAPWVLGAQVAGLVLVAVCLWREAGRRTESLSAVVALVAGDCALRALVSPGAGGVEVVHALPLLAGIGLGLAPGVLTGAGAALASTMIASTPAETLPAQAVVWAVVGAAGSALRWIPTLAAWLLALPLALGLGVLSGVLLNLIGWAQQPGITELHFAPGLPPGEVVARVWAYTAETSLVLDLVRGATTALLVLVLGRPVLKALRAPSRCAPDLASAPDLELARAVRRRETDRSARLWATVPDPQEKP